MATLDRNSLNANAATRISDNNSEAVTPANERQQMIDLADSSVNRVTDPGIVFGIPRKLVAQTVNNGITPFTHNAGHTAKTVTFTDVDGWPIDLMWRAKPSDPSASIEVSSNEVIENVTINLICWT